MVSKFEVIRRFREAQSRANNVARDLGDVDWFCESAKQDGGFLRTHIPVEKSLKQIHKEAQLVEELLKSLLETE